MTKIYKIYKEKNYLDMIPETTKEYYEKKSEHITDKFTKQVQDNIEIYDGFVNTPFEKSMIRLKYEYDLEQQIEISEDEVIDILIDESLSKIIYSSITKSEIEEEDIYLLKDLDKDIDRILQIKVKDEIEKIKYLFIGKAHLSLFSDLDGNNQGKYKGLDIFYIEDVEDIYLSNESFIDLNTLDVKYNEYVKKEFYGLYSGKDLYEDIPNKMKRGVITINCILGLVKIYKIETEKY